MDEAAGGPPVALDGAVTGASDMAMPFLDESGQAAGSRRCAGAAGDRTAADPAGHDSAPHDCETQPSRIVISTPRCDGHHHFRRRNARTPTTIAAISPAAITSWPSGLDRPVGSM